MLDANSLTHYDLVIPNAESDDVTGSAVDISGAIGNLKITQQIGTVGGTSPTYDGKIQDSADGSTDWTDVSGATFAQVTDSSDETSSSISVESRLCRRYIRYVGTSGGTSPTVEIAVSAVAFTDTNS